MVSARKARLTVQIVQSTLEADDVVSLLFRAPDNAELPEWRPGAHIDLYLPSGLVRQYSLCGDPADTKCYRIAVLRQASGRGGSIEVHDALRVGQSVELAGPRNAFALLPASRYLFVAGGIGITPILPMVRQAAAEERNWKLIYGGRTARSMPFADILSRFDDRCLQLQPCDQLGPIDLDAIAAAAADGTEVYACGPQSLLDGLEARFSNAGRSAQLHLERFAAQKAAPLPTDGSFRVFLARTGGHVDVAPNCSVLEALRRAGVILPSSCEQGFCGTCETRVLDGRPDHRDDLLSESERASGKVMMPCVSRALTKELTLDV